MTDTNTQAVLLKPWGIIAPTKGTFFVAACAQDSATTAMPLIVRSACYGANHFGPMASAIGYAPGGTLSAFILAGTANADWCAGIVPIT